MKPGRIPWATKLVLRTSGSGLGAATAKALKAKGAKIALLDLAVSQPTVDVLRNQGFLQGFGIDLADADFDISQLDTIGDLESLVGANV